MATNFNIPIQNSLNTPLKTDFSTQNAVNSSSDNVWKADLQETTEFGGDTYIYSPHTCKEHCLGYIICWRPHSKYEAKGGKQLVYYNDCTYCGGSWHAKLVNKQTGESTVLGYTTGMTLGQGCCAACCPCGDRVIQNFYDAEGTRLYTIGKKVTCANCCFLGENCCTVCIAQCSDTYAWYRNENYVVLSEDLLDATGENTVGEINQLFRIDPVTCCQTTRVPITYTVKMYDPSNNSAALVSLLPRFYLGVKAPAACCHKAPAVPLTGVNCVDSGRNYTMTRGNFEKILSVAGQPEELEMQR